MHSTADDLAAHADHQEKMRRRARVEQRRSPAQLTPRSRNKARMHKRPGKGHRHAWRREVTA
ncbi:hypothetical protein [Mycolicibacterium palauense]|uniref:hypothetical protein n=1 Tax=Mycolicibacterium palauense TaxID=2034511 RepID=UPI001145C5E5|nr:hypothetical protein [Mycolicibacterium palauense]